MSSNNNATPCTCSAYPFPHRKNSNPRRPCDELLAVADAVFVRRTTAGRYTHDRRRQEEHDAILARIGEDPIVYDTTVRDSQGESKMCDQNRNLTLLNRIQQLEATVEQLDNMNSLLIDVMVAYHDFAVCDKCQHRWFTYKGSPGDFNVVRGDANGLLVAGGARCTHCLDELHEDVSTWRTQYPEDWDNTCREIAYWLVKYPANKRAAGPWLSESRVKDHMKARLGQI